MIEHEVHVYQVSGEIILPRVEGDSVKEILDRAHEMADGRPWQPPGVRTVALILGSARPDECPDCQTSETGHCWRHIEPLGEITRGQRFVCSECGPTAVDDDGCCITCGAAATVQP